MPLLSLGAWVRPSLGEAIWYGGGSVCVWGCWLLLLNPGGHWASLTAGMIAWNSQAVFWMFLASLLRNQERILVQGA
jgi:hypothetical protein